MKEILWQYDSNYNMHNSLSVLSLPLSTTFDKRT